MEGRRDKQENREQELLRLAYRAADIGALVWTVATDRLEVDESTERLFGLRRGTFGATLRDLIKKIREESRDLVIAAIERVLGDGNLLEVEMIVDVPDGTSRHLQLRGTVLHDPAGQPEHVVAAVRDVTREATLRTEVLGLEHDVKVRDDELRRITTTLATNARVTANLMSRTSHDIRTRLDGILGMSRILLDSELTPEQRELVSTVRTQGDGMLAIVADLVDMSTTSAEIDVTTVAIRELVTDVIGGVPSAAIQIEDGVPPVLRTDAARLRRILQNLLANVRPEKASVEVRAKPIGGQLLELAVAVHGIGVGADRIPHLFDVSAPQTGLSFAISAKLVGLLGGRIEAAAGTDDTIGVRFTLPVELADGQDAHQDAIVDPELGRKHPLRVLVAEDNLLNRKVAGAFLGKLGYTAQYANNGREALDALDRERFDVVFMDVDMPIMDGIEAARELRRKQPREHAPRLVAVTANALPRDRAVCLEAGYDDYLSKPLRIEQLAAQLVKCKRLPDVSIDPAIVDVAVLAVLDETLGPAVVEELVATYDSDARELMTALESAAQRGDGTGLARAAHTLRSISAALGAGSLGALCAEIETNGRAGIVAGASALVERVVRELSHVRVALNEHVSRAKYRDTRVRG